MKLDNMCESITLTNPSNNSHYLLNLAQPCYTDEETKTLINMIQLLAEENQYLRKENQRLAKSHR
ncbi:hypothetical protein [Candidatus Arsenophonus triatominarum]|uniref:hypothetical protein n=1 Tax=Candidatus Arsenophonus triatominarum TaxID=57911 RepID=UPI0007C5776C|nr:hypothetical protein [Candidatus Arsenophonus triatominarum]